MDRNYFLSYGQIAFLLLISAMGNLNTGFVSVTIGKSELLHYIDINKTGSHQPMENENIQKNVNDSSYHHAKENDTFQYIVFHNRILQNNPPIINDKDFFLFSVENMKFISVQYKWREQYLHGNENTRVVFERVKKFSINSFKLIDGFRCIIKIPDKLATPLNIS
ncbi:hypothetical protein [Chryseobacterium joostei]|uniref:hypothetical protein n=1 Tax=Chryseobacterium joostei TaxID=112234 RepID=UPI003D0B7054